MSRHREPAFGTRDGREAVARCQPGVRSVTDAPLPGTARLLLAALLLLILGLLAWASLARIEVVAFAEGETVVSSRVQPVAAMERATVARVLVGDGDRVAAGDPLIRLTSDAVRARVRSLRERLDLARAARARVAALLAAEPGQPPAIPASLDVPPAVRLAAGRRARAQWAAHRAELRELEQALANAQAERDTARTEVQAAERVLPYLERRAERRRRLHARGIEPASNVDEAESLRVEHEGELRVLRRRLAGAQGRLALARQRRSMLSDAFRAELLAERDPLDDRIAELRQQLAGAEQRLAQRTLTAPIAGIVQDLSVTGQGRVVEPAEVLLRVVPAERPIEVQARILDRDIGLARPGQPVDVKLAAFDYTRYGAIPGTVEKIAPSGSEDARGGRYYSATVALERAWVDVEGERVPIRPGLGATVDVELGRRRIIEYFLAPVLRYREQALREQ